jgi:hypothetical protein
MSATPLNTDIPPADRIADISRNKLLFCKISDFCRLRVDPVLPLQESARIKSFLLYLIGLSRTPPRSARGYH